MHRNPWVLAASLASLVASCGAGSDPAPARLFAAAENGGDSGRYLIMLKPGTASLDVLRALVARRGFVASELSISAMTAAFEARAYARVEQMALRLTHEDLSLLEGHDIVRAVHPVKPVHMSAVQSAPPSWGLDRIDQAALPLDKKFAYADRAGMGVRAFIIDTGIDPQHVDFTGRLLEGFTSIQDGKGTLDCQGHGTHVAGTVAGSSFGIAKKAAIVAVRVLGCDGSGTDEGVVAGMNWVLQEKAASPNVPMVANMSLGGDPSEPMDDAVRRLVQGGVFLAVAAGNESQDACNVSPARAPAAVTVGATENTDERSDFSNFGHCVDIYAPGTSIYSAKVGGGGRYLSGTSMASPHVAGAAALILGNHPTDTPAQVEARMKAQAVRGVPAGDAGNLLLQVDKENLGTPAPTPLPTAQPTPVPAPGTGTSRLYEGTLGNYGVKTLFVRQSELPIQGNLHIEAKLSGPANRNFDLTLRVWDKSRMKWVDGPAGRRPDSSETVVWAGEATSFEWTVRNMGRDSGAFKLAVTYGR